MEFEAIAVIPQTEQNETHQADVVQVNIHLDHDFLNSLNLTSSPAFFILKNKKLPSRIAHEIIAREIISSPH